MLMMIDNIQQVMVPLGGVVRFVTSVGQRARRSVMTNPFHECHELGRCRGNEKRRCTCRRRGPVRRGNVGSSREYFHFLVRRRLGRW